MADLRAGRGMGLALAAELNGYPGPRHVLEHADALGLIPEQRQRTQALFETPGEPSLAEVWAATERFRAVNVALAEGVSLLE